jgi:hypothetical protein
MRRHSWMGALFLCVAACDSGSSLPPELGNTEAPDAGYQPPTAAIPAAESTVYSLQVGGTVPVAPGTQVGYALTAPQPMSYLFRWTGDAKVGGQAYSKFYGSVWTTGHFTLLTPGCTNQACPLETGDYVSGINQVTGGGERIDWNTNASTGWDGFSFATDTEPLYFDVFVDGNAQPNLFVFPEAPGGQPTSPAANPFGIQSTN